MRKNLPCGEKVSLPQKVLPGKKGVFKTGEALGTGVAKGQV